MGNAKVPASSTVYTPRDLAAAMVAASRGGLSSLWLDPCVGDGVFVTQMAVLGVTPKQIFAIDIASKPGPVDCAAQTLRGIDFLEWALEHRGSVDHVVMNPPYVALSRVRGKLRDRALGVCMWDGQPLPLKANYWAAFLLSAVNCVRAGGSLVAVLPAAWDFAKYAAGVRETVFRAFGEVTVVRCASPLFPGVQEGVVVVAAFDREAQTRVRRRIEVPNLTATIGALFEVAQRKLPRGASTTSSVGRQSGPTFKRLDELVQIQIGAVTGDAGYFLLSEQQRKGWGIPQEALRPALTRCRHLVSSAISHGDWMKLRDQDARVWLFCPTKGALQHHAVKAYLKHGEQGGCNVSAYKIASRDPWYRTSMPMRVDAFMSGMSKRLPFLVLREMPKLTASNTLYVIRFRGRASPADKATLGLLLLTSTVRKELAWRARIYADGLMKFEPSDLGAVRLPVVSANGDAPRVFREATALLLAGREAQASAMADAWMESAADKGSQSVALVTRAAA